MFLPLNFASQLHSGLFCADTHSKTVWRVDSKSLHHLPRSFTHLSIEQSAAFAFQSQAFDFLRAAWKNPGLALWKSPRKYKRIRKKSAMKSGFFEKIYKPFRIENRLLGSFIPLGLPHVKESASSRHHRGRPFTLFPSDFHTETLILWSCEGFFRGKNTYIIGVFFWKNAAFDMEKSPLRLPVSLLGPAFGLHHLSYHSSFGSPETWRL